MDIYEQAVVVMDIYEQASAQGALLRAAIGCVARAARLRAWWHHTSPPGKAGLHGLMPCLLYTSPSPRDS